MTVSPFSDTGLCVKCGLCLPHCPTYGKTLDENESPRGRLSLIQAWAAGQLQATPKLLGHIDNCLQCRSCESACPAYVPYGRLVDDFRAATTNKMVKPFAAKLKSTAVRLSLQSPRFQRWSGPVRQVLSKTGLLRVSGFSELAAGLPEPFNHSPWHGLHPALGKETSRVALFLGCTAELADAETVTSAIRLLTRIGVGVTVPPNQGCCGGMALHAGDVAGFAQMRKRNLEAFDINQFDAILTLASGCGAVLKEYQDQGMAAQIRDISSFLVDYSWPKNAALKPLQATVLVHSPCSLKNVLNKADQHPPVLLRRIQGLRVELLASTPNCCGAAGTYLLDHPAMANALREDILNEIKAYPPNYVATSNVGCAMHLRAGLMSSGMETIQVLHPLVLLERQLQSV